METENRGSGIRKEFTIPSVGVGRLHCCRWTPAGEIRAVVQIIHGIAEFVERYDDFAGYLNSLGFLVVAEDHMGHGQSVGKEGIQGYFHGGWFAAVEDSVNLLRQTREEYPDVPYILFGHSMGSFMTRTILAKYPDTGITAAVICGTGWQPRPLLPVAIRVCQAVCSRVGEQNPSPWLQNLVFGGYNAHVEHPRTEYDWLTRDKNMVDAYIAHPSCGFTASSGLLRELLKGILYVEQPENLGRMKKDLPILFVAGGEDPVGSYGKGVKKTAEEFKKAGMEDVRLRLFPLCRHEILNEINRQEIYEFISSWMESKASLG